MSNENPPLKISLPPRPIPPAQARIITEQNLVLFFRAVDSENADIIEEVFRQLSTPYVIHP